jgi:hypothetical protein
MTENLTKYLGGGEQAVNLSKAVEPFTHSLWLIAAAARAHAYGSQKPDTHLIGVEYAAGPSIIGVVESLGFVDDGVGNWKGEVDGRTTIFFGVNIGRYLTETVFAGDGIAVRLDTGAAIVTPEFWVREADYQVRPLEESGNEERDAAIAKLMDQSKSELEAFKEYLETEAARVAAFHKEVEAKALEQAVQQTDVGSGEQQLELELAGRN